jgi:hypothetical protein
MHERVYASKLYATYQTLLHPDWSCCRDRVNRAASQRSVVFVFAEPSWQFYRDMTNPAHLSGLLHLDSFFMTRRFSSIYRDCAKTNPTATLTATKLYRRPLAARQITASAHSAGTSDARARVLQPVPATVPSLQNTCFLVRPDSAV